MNLYLVQEDELILGIFGDPYIADIVSESLNKKKHNTYVQETSLSIFTPDTYNLCNEKLTPKITGKPGSIEDLASIYPSHVTPTYLDDNRLKYTYKTEIGERAIEFVKQGMTPLDAVFNASIREITECYIVRSKNRICNIYASHDNAVKDLPILSSIYNTTRFEIIKYDISLVTKNSLALNRYGNQINDNLLSKIIAHKYKHFYQ